MRKSLLTIVIPVFNEEESIKETFKRLQEVSVKISEKLDVELIFVDDGSKDNSLEILTEIANANESVKIVSFSRNFGHQFAVTAGIDYAQGDFVVLIDADLQDPPELIEDMYEMALSGYDVVYGKRVKRSGETLFKKVTANLFYRFLNYMCAIEIPRDTGDFRLMSRKVVDQIKGMRERHRFIRGMVPWVGFKSAPLHYERSERFAGVTKYPLSKMIEFATNAILSFSVKPLAITIRLGLLVMFLGITAGLILFYLRIFHNFFIPGFAAIILTVIFFGGVNIFLIGVVGEYISRIFEEIKNRPLYVVDRKINI